MRRLGVALALAVAACHASPKVTIAFSLVTSNPDPDPDWLSSRLSPRFTSCDSCSRVAFESPGGWRLSVLAEPEPRIRLTESDVVRVRVREERQVMAPYASVWQVVLQLDPGARERYSAAFEDYPDDRGLAAINGKPTDVARLGDLRVAVFASPEPATEFARKLGFPVLQEPFDEAAWREAKRAFEEMPR